MKASFASEIPAKIAIRKYLDGVACVLYISQYDIIAMRYIFDCIDNGEEKQKQFNFAQRVQR
ncbi:MAG TPA: hypothetical protein VG938_12285 [Verrucomicrobiae bacterium]|nr:hypothetical protein [Verrucomicrobiae bacterium]